MKIDRYSRASRHCGVKQLRFVVIAMVAVATLVLFATPRSQAADATPAVERAAKGSDGSPGTGPATAASDSSVDAIALLRRVIRSVGYGPAFDAKIRETVWASGRKVVGVGTYEQSGKGTGQFNLQITMHDGDGKHRLQQISDGRLCWTRTEVAGEVQLRRVDVGQLEKWVRGAMKQDSLAPRLRVGAWTEMLSLIERDYDLTLRGAQLDGQQMVVLDGKLKTDRRKKTLLESSRSVWPMLYPTRVKVAVAIEPDRETGFGQLVPRRIEFWSDPVVSDVDLADAGADQQGRLITLIELYSLRSIDPPPAVRFRYENHDSEVNFVNETSRYVEMYGVQLTERQRRQLRR